MGLYRLLLALSVVIYHAFPLFGYTLLGGAIPVNVFFIISGFYMTLILSEKYVGKNGSYKLFITNRILRIYPLYWVILGLTIFFGYLWFYTGGNSPFAFGPYFHHSPFIFYSNFQGMLQDITLLFRTDYLVINPLKFNFMLIGQAWTLVVELLFYFLAPFLFKRNWKILGLLILGSLLIRYLVLHWTSLNGVNEQTHFFPAKLFFFVFGIFSYRIYGYIKKRKVQKKILLGILLLLFLFTFAFPYLPSLQIRFFPVTEWMYYMVVISAVPAIFFLYRNISLDLWLGELSYPVYLSHMFFYMVLVNYTKVKQASVLFTTLLILLTLVGSFLLILLVDKPIDKCRQKRLSS